MSLAELAFFKSKEELEQDLVDAGAFVKRMNEKRAEQLKRNKEHMAHDAQKQKIIDDKKQKEKDEKDAETAIKNVKRKENLVI